MVKTATKEVTKTKHRCLNDFFAYCKGTPDHEVKPSEKEEGRSGWMIAGKCKNDPTACPKYQKASDVLKEVEGLGKNPTRRTLTVGD